MKGKQEREDSYELDGANSGGTGCVSLGMRGGKRGAFSVEDEYAPEGCGQASHRSDHRLGAQVHGGSGRDDGWAALPDADGRGHEQRGGVLPDVGVEPVGLGGERGGDECYQLGLKAIYRHGSEILALYGVLGGVGAVAFLVGGAIRMIRGIGEVARIAEERRRDARARGNREA